MPRALRALAGVVVVLVVALGAPLAAEASRSQLSVLQDDAELFGDHGEDPAAAMREIRDLGVDVIRTNVLFYRVYREMADRTKPAGFDASNPDEPLYNWAAIDRVVRLANENGLQVMFTVSGPGPFWASEDPKRCKAGEVCTYKPDAAAFGDFTAAVAKRYAGKVDWYSLYNEPNLKTWLSPESKATAAGRVEVAGVYYRRLWSAGYKAIAQNDPARRNRVLFGEVAGIGDPLQLLGAALCLDYRTGKAFKGKLRTAHSCPKRPAKLNIGGYAIHPYNYGAYGTPFTTLGRPRAAALMQAYLPRLHRFMDRAAATGRNPPAAVASTSPSSATRPVRPTASPT